MVGNDCLDTTPKALNMKETTDKLYFIKIKIFCSAKGTVKVMKVQGIDGEKIFAKDTSDKELLSKIHK